MQQVAFAYDMYSSIADNSWILAGHFKKCFCITVDIKFIGVWYVFSCPYEISMASFPVRAVE
jgi:hypothetical protein